MDTPHNRQIISLSIMALYATLPLILFIFVLLTKQTLAVKNKMASIIKFPKNNVAKFLRYAYIISAFVLILDIVFIKDMRYSINLFIILISAVIMFTDELMAKHSKYMIREASGLNTLKEKMTYSLFIEHIVLWDRYLTYSITLGVNKKVLERIPSMENISIKSIDRMKISF